MKRHRRNRKPYRDNVLTVPTTPDRFALEEKRIKEAWTRSQSQRIVLKPGERAEVAVDGRVHTITNSTDTKVELSLSPTPDTSKDN